MNPFQPEQENAVARYFARSVSASYVSFGEIVRTGGVPPVGVEPLMFWIMPTNTRSLVGSIQNHVPKAPPQ